MSIPSLPSHGSTSWYTWASGIHGALADPGSSTELRAAFGSAVAYNLKPSQLRRTRAALAKAAAGTGFARIGVVGESTSAGYGATPQKAWPLALRNLLDARGYPANGTGLAPANSQVTDSRWTFGAGWGAFAGVQSSVYATNQNTAIEFASDKPGTEIRVYYLNAGAAFWVGVDGPIDHAVATDGGDTLGVYSRTGLTRGVHTVHIEPVNPPGTSPYIIGVEVRDGNSGVLVYNAGISGANSADHDQPDYWKTTQTVATMWASDLICLMIETNDASTTVAPATYKSRMQSIINRLRVNSADLLLMTGLSAQAASVADFTPYNTALRELADTNDLPLLDLQARWGTWETANALGMMTDAAHANAAGYQDVGAAVAAVLGV